MERINISRIRHASFYLLITFITSGCSDIDLTDTKSNPTPLAVEPVVNKISEVTIGNQTWMLENLNVETFRNGDTIPEAKTAQEWIEAFQNMKPAWCYYNNDPANGKIYGKLYNYYAITDSRRLAPTGWCIPSRGGVRTGGGWFELLNYFGGNGEGEKMKSTNGWLQYGNGNNASGFTGLPGGHRSWNGNFEFIGYLSEWWALDYNYIPLYWNQTEIKTPSIVGSYRNLEGYGFSVRCLKGNCDEDLLNQLAQSNKNLYETLDPVPSEEIINNKIDENTSKYIKAKFIGIEIGDYVHFIFESDEGKQYDFWDIENKMGNLISEDGSIAKQQFVGTYFDINFIKKNIDISEGNTKDYIEGNVVKEINQIQ